MIILWGILIVIEEQTMMELALQKINTRCEDDNIVWQTEEGKTGSFVISIA